VPTVASIPAITGIYDVAVVTAAAAVANLTAVTGLPAVVNCGVSFSCSHLLQSLLEVLGCIKIVKNLNLCGLLLYQYSRNSS
jgi:hypothetical protein